MPPDLPSPARAAHSLGALVDRPRSLVLLVLTLVYAIGAIGHARAKPLWYDEIITLIAASAPLSRGRMECTTNLRCQPAIDTICSPISRCDASAPVKFPS